MKGKQIKKQLREIVAANPNLPLQAEVTSLEDDTCTVKLATGLELNDVRLKATIGGSDDNYFIQRPKIGSKVVLLSITGSLDDLMVLKIDELENVEFSQGGLSILIDSEDGKIAIENENTSLKDIFQTLADLLKAFKVYTPAGPSGTALPDVVLQIEGFETQFKELLK